MPKEKAIKHPIIKRAIPMIFISITPHLVASSFSYSMIQKKFDKYYIKKLYVVKITKNKEGDSNLCLHCLKMEN